MSPTTSMFGATKSFRDVGLHWVESTPEELKAVTEEMLERTTDIGLLSTIPDNNLQRRLKALAETCGLKYGGRRVKAFASISRDFLEMHANLLDDNH